MLLGALLDPPFLSFSTCSTLPCKYSCMLSSFCSYLLFLSPYYTSSNDYQIFGAFTVSFNCTSCTWSNPKSIKFFYHCFCFVSVEYLDIASTTSLNKTLSNDSSTSIAMFRYHIVCLLLVLH